VVVRSILSCRASRIRIEPSLLEGGVSIGAYRLIDKLGAGGMGEVWRAKHALIARPAAVKLIKNQEGGPPKEEVLERFRREASVTANLLSGPVVRARQAD
jgi:serine/threonine protein kinase